MKTLITNAEKIETKRVNKHGTITGFKKYLNRFVIVAVIEQKRSDSGASSEEEGGEA